MKTSDGVVLALAVGTLAYAAWTLRSKKVAGFDTTPPPAYAHTDPSTKLPGVPAQLLRAFARASDSLSLPGPTSPAGSEPEDIERVCDFVLKKVRAIDSTLELSRIGTDSASVLKDASGSKEFRIVFVAYERQTNVGIKLVTIVTEQHTTGIMGIVEVRPYNNVPQPSDKAPRGTDPTKNECGYASYQLPIPHI